MNNRDSPQRDIVRVAKLKFQEILEDSSRKFQKILENSRRSQKILENPRRFQEILEHPRKSYEILQNSKKSQNIVENPLFSVWLLQIQSISSYKIFKKFKIPVFLPVILLLHHLIILKTQIRIKELKKILYELSIFFIEFSRYTPYQFMQERQKCKKRQKMHVKFQKSCRIFLDLLEIELSLCGES